MRKSYVQTRNVAPNVSSTSNNRPTALVGNGEFNVVRMSGLSVTNSKTRNANEMRTKQLGGVGLTLTQKISTTLESEGLPGVACMGQ